MIQGSDNGTPQPRDEPLAENPPFGAIIDYYIKSGANGPVVLEILDAAGDLFDVTQVRISQRQSILTRLIFLLFGDPTVSVIRSSGNAPMGLGSASHATDYPTGGPGGGGGGGGFGFGRPTVLPGKYSVKLIVAGQTLTQPLTVEPDPRRR